MDFAKILRVFIDPLALLFTSLGWGTGVRADLFSVSREWLDGLRLALMCGQGSTFYGFYTHYIHWLLGIVRCLKEAGWAQWRTCQIYAMRCRAWG